MQLRAAHRLLPRWLLRDAQPGRRRAPRLRAGDGRVPRVQRLARQRPRHAAPGDALSRTEARRSLVPPCPALGRSLGGGQAAARDPRGHARERPQVRAARRAQAPLPRPQLRCRRPTVLWHSERPMSQAPTATEYRLLVQHSPVMIWRSGLDAACDYFNETWLAFTGRTLEQEMGNGWAEGVHPEDFKRCVKHYLDHFHRRQEFEMEYRLRRHDGAWRWIFDRGVPFTNDDGEFA